MKHHAASHGLAVFGCTLSAALLAKEFESILPQARQSLFNFASPWLSEIGLEWDQSTVTTVLMATVLATLWGLFFGAAHNFFTRNKRDSQ